MFLGCSRGLVVKATAFLWLRRCDGFNANDLRFVKEESHRHLVGHQLQALSSGFILRGLGMHQGFQIALPGARAFAIRRHRHIHRSKSFLLEAIHVFSPGIASLLARCDKGLVDGFDGLRSSLGHREGARTSSISRFTSLMTLSFAVVGQDVPVGPGITTFTDLGRPTFIVHGVPSHISHGIETRRTSQSPSSGLMQSSAIHMPLRHRVEIPIVLGICQIESQCCWHVDLPPIPTAIVTTTILDQQYAGSSILRQSVRDRGTSGTSANNDVVISSFG
mmetsp:Transcript_85824/g.105294  ORF Transcript_85824/g.105294 Transcript_85824/m.105294 type:complete len:277 (-) Transcript_85824:84-914(-)